MDRINLGDSSDLEFVKGLGLSPKVVYADTLFGTGKDRVGSEGVYGDGKAKAKGFTSGMIEAMHDILDQDGTMWLHCNQESNYIYRAEMNRVFGASNFLCEVVWGYASGGRPKRTMAAKHDTIFWYAKDHRSDYTYNIVREPYRSLKPGETRKGFDPDGKPITSFWADIGILSTTSKERVGYPTQKPLKLLERILTISSNPDDVVLDPCCGSGTTIDAALSMGRDGYGIDVNPEAVSVATARIASHQ